MHKKISYENYDFLTEEEKNVVIDKLKNTYKGIKSNDEYTNDVLDTLSSIGIRNVRELEVSFNKDTYDLTVSGSIYSNDINLKLFVDSMKMYCILNSMQVERFREAIEETDFSIQIIYKYKSNKSYCVIDSIDRYVKDLNEKPITLINDVLELTHDKFKDEMKFIEKEELLLDKWNKDKIEIIIEGDIQYVN